MLAQQQEADMNVVEQCFDVVDKATFRDGMSRLGSAVNVVTTRYGGKRYGLSGLQRQRYTCNPSRLHQSCELVFSCI